MAHMCMSHVTHMNEQWCHAYQWVMSHTWMSHVTHMNKSRYTYEWVMPHKSAGSKRATTGTPGSISPSSSNSFMRARPSLLKTTWYIPFFFILKNLHCPMQTTRKSHSSMRALSSLLKTIRYNSFFKFWIFLVRCWLGLLCWRLHSMIRFFDFGLFLDRKTVQKNLCVDPNQNFKHSYISMQMNVQTKNNCICIQMWFVLFLVVFRDDRVFCGKPPSFLTTIWRQCLEGNSAFPENAD